MRIIDITASENGVVLDTVTFEDVPGSEPVTLSLALEAPGREVGFDTMALGTGEPDPKPGDYDSKHDRGR